jgi:hypothetical protein
MDDMGGSDRRSQNTNCQDGKESGKINCLNCSHFFITYDPHEPYGCRAMGFKSRQFPSDVAESCSGLKCQMYTPKKKRRNEDEAL